jgi:hypothetical protein
MTPQSRAVTLRSAAQRAAVSTAPMRSQQALAQVDDLQRALAACQQRAVAAEHQAQILAKANAQFSELAVRHGVPLRRRRICSPAPRGQ